MNTTTGKGRLRDAKLFLLLIPAILIPFGGELGTVKSLQVSELAVPLLFFLTVLDFAVRTKDVKRFQNAPGNILGVLMLIFFFVILLNYIRNPVLPTSLSGESGALGGFKTYYRFVNGFLIYLMVIYWTGEKGVSPGLLIRVLALTVLIICIAGVLVRFTGITIPGLESMTWGALEVGGSDETSGSVRVGVLDQFGQIGLLLAITGVAFRRRYLWLGLSLFFAASIFLGGGRVGLVSTLGAILLFAFLKRKFLLGGVLLACGVLAVASIQVIHQLAPDAQTARLTNIDSLETASVGRYYLYKYGLESFAENPVFGSGYGREIDIDISNDPTQDVYEDWAKKQLSLGGHATHIAILKNMGLLGYIPFIMMWIYSFLKLLPLAISRPGVWDERYRRNAQFVLILIAALLVRMLVEGNGSELQLYLYIGIAAAVINEWLYTGRATTYQAAVETVSKQAETGILRPRRTMAGKESDQVTGVGINNIRTRV